MRHATMLIFVGRGSAAIVEPHAPSYSKNGGSSSLALNDASCSPAAARSSSTTRIRQADRAARARGRSRDRHQQLGALGQQPHCGRRGGRRRCSDRDDERIWRPTIHCAGGARGISMSGPTLRLRGDRPSRSVPVPRFLCGRRRPPVPDDHNRAITRLNASGSSRGDPRPARSARGRVHHPRPLSSIHATQQAAGRSSSTSNGVLTRNPVRARRAHAGMTSRSYRRRAAVADARRKRFVTVAITNRAQVARGDITSTISSQSGPLERCTSRPGGCSIAS